MAKLSILAGATSQSCNLFIQDSTSTTGQGLAGLVFNTASLAAYYSFSGANCTAVAISLATLAGGVTNAWATGGFIEIDATHMKGWYRFDIPNAALAASKGRSVSVHFYGAANMAPCPLEIELTGWDNQDGVRGGLTALPNAAANAAGGLPISTAGALDMDDIGADVDAIQTSTAGLTYTVSNQVDVNVLDWKSATAPAMTGDAFARLGAPTGASIAADIQEIEAETDTIVTITTGLTFTVPNQVDVNVVDWKGSAAPAMTGDAFARLGAPAGASVSADVAAIKSDTGTTLTDVNAGAGAIYTRLGAPVGASLSADIAAVADTVWDEVMSDHTTAGTTGAALNAAGAAADPLATAVPGAYGAGTAGFRLGTYLTGDAYVRLGAPAGASIAADLVEIEGETDGIAAIPTSNGTGQTGDVYALFTGTNTELAAVPASTGTLVQMIRWLFLLARNRITQSGTTTTVFADDNATTVATSAVSDSGTVFTRAKMT